MDSESADSSVQPPARDLDVETPTRTVSTLSSAAHDSPSVVSASCISSEATPKLPQPSAAAQDNSKIGNTGTSTFARLTGGFGLRFPSKASVPEQSTEGTSTTAQTGVFESFTKGFVDSSRNAVKAVQLKARHIVSQNKRRYQEGGFDLDMTYITDNIIAMGFPAGDMSSGFFFGYVEGFYRNHMEEVIKFFETHHKGKYKVYNLCSERLYDASVFEGKVGCFPFDDHNCPPIQLIRSFCQSAHSWLKEDSENVVVVHCKAGMARTGLMICSLLLYLKFFPTAEEAIDYYNQKRCVDGKGLVLPSQIRYVKYFERLLIYFNGEIQPGRRCMLRGFRLHKCPYWIRPSITISDHNGILFSTKKHPKTKDLMPEDFWITARKKKIVVFALPGEPGVTELAGDFKIHFHDRQGDFYCWLNTTMTENRKILDPSDLDGFDKRRVPSPGFQVEVVMIDYDETISTKSEAETATNRSEGTSGYVASNSGITATSNRNSASDNQDKDDVFSDSDSEETGSSKIRQTQASSERGAAAPDSKSNTMSEQIGTVTHGTDKISLRSNEPSQIDSSHNPNYGMTTKSSSGLDSVGGSDIKAMAADASVFTFGDDEDYESE